MNGDDRPEGWEEWLAYFENALPAPVEQAAAPDGSITYRSGDPGEVIVHLSPGTITVSQFTVQFMAPDQPMIVARPVGYLKWRRVDANHATAVVEALLSAARAARRATFRTCVSCETLRPPEMMADEGMCLLCAAPTRDTVH